MESVPLAILCVRSLDESGRRSVGLGRGQTKPLFEAQAGLRDWGPWAKTAA